MAPTSAPMATHWIKFLLTWKSPDDRTAYCAALGFDPPSSADPAKTVRPSGSFTDRALQVLVPSFARRPSMVMMSPFLKASLVQSLRVSEFGGPPSHCHRTTFPPSSFASR